MEFVLGYLAGSGASWLDYLLVGGGCLVVLVIIQAITGKDLS